jgi:hypothetical protein
MDVLSFNFLYHLTPVALEVCFIYLDLLFCRPKVETVIDIENIQNGRYSILRVTTGDRPGLLTDIVRILKDISVNLVSAEVMSLSRAVPLFSVVLC